MADFADTDPQSDQRDVRGLTAVCRYAYRFIRSLCLIVLMSGSIAFAQSSNFNSASLIILNPPITLQATDQVATGTVTVVSPIDGNLKVSLLIKGKPKTVTLLGSSGTEKFEAGVPKVIDLRIDGGEVKRGETGTLVFFMPNLQIHTEAVSVEPASTWNSLIPEILKPRLPWVVYLFAFLGGAAWLVYASVRLPNVVTVKVDGTYGDSAKARFSDFLAGTLAWSGSSHLPNFAFLSSVFSAIAAFSANALFTPSLMPVAQYTIITAAFALLAAAAIGLLNASRLPVLNADNVSSAAGNLSSDDQGTQYRIGSVIFAGALIFSSIVAQMAVLALILIELSISSTIPWIIFWIGIILLLSLLVASAKSSVNLLISSIAANGRQSKDDGLPGLIEGFVNRRHESIREVASQIPAALSPIRNRSGIAMTRSELLVQPYVKFDLTAPKVNAHSQDDATANAWMSRISSRVPLP
ncbi:hypothetical protein ACMT4L_14040 [Deinococcus sp. A31D244]|uniref:hypothetical protein n=1 Tax=Deinococcus sp. A31D244 TaxID=3397675 RepID=UPI0039E0A02C